MTTLETKSGLAVARRFNEQRPEGYYGENA